MKNKIGVFGSSFDPIHFGHINSMVTVAERLDLDRVLAIPASNSPSRTQTQGASPEQRLEMARLGARDTSPLVEVEDLEIRRGGVSYTVETLRELTQKYIDSSLFVIIGLDQFQKFDDWKEYEEILRRADLVVTSRPGFEFPYSLERMPPGVRGLVEDFDGRQALLKNGHTIHFVQLEDVDASSTEIRKKIRIGQSVQQFVPRSVEDFIVSEHLYESVSKKIGDFKKFTLFCAAHLKEKGGIQIRGFDLTSSSAPTDYSLITSGTSTRHATSLAESLVKEIKKEYGVWPQSMEGQGEGRWIVVDYGSLIIHSFYDFVRHEYRLEQLWKDAAELPL